MISKTIFRLWLAIFAWVAVPTMAQARDGTPPYEPRPALWLLADADTRIYLFGTIHILPPGFRWRSKAFDRIVASADELVLENVEDEADGGLETANRHMMLAKPRPILARVSAERREPLRRLIKMSGIQAGQLDRMRNWSAAITLSLAPMMQAYNQELGPGEEITGVEDELTLDFEFSGRPVSAVETGDQQLGFLSGLSAATQQAMLDSVVDGYAEGPEPDFSLLNWVLGKPESLDVEFEPLPAELRDALLTRRNAAWTEWLAARLERPGTILFAVGAGHLAGRDSVPALLARRGLTVRRVH